MPSKNILPSSSIVTLATLILSSFIYWLYVTCKIILASSSKFTLVTVILSLIMYWLYVMYKITLCSISLFTLLTLKLSSFIYWLYMTYKIIFLSRSIFTLVTKNLSKSSRTSWKWFYCTTLVLRIPKRYNLNRFWWHFWIWGNFWTKNSSRIFHIM